MPLFPVVKEGVAQGFVEIPLFDGFQGPQGPQGAQGPQGGGGEAESPLGKHTVFVPATAIKPRQSNGCAALAFVEFEPDKENFPFLGFDQNTDEYAQFLVMMPKSWDLGAVGVKIFWSRGTATGTFTTSWGVSCGAFGSGEALTSGFGSEVEVASMAPTEDVAVITGESAAITPSGTPTKNGTGLLFQIRRITANDELNVDARLHGITVLYTTDAANDN